MGLIRAFSKSVRPLSWLVVRFGAIACLVISFGREPDAGLFAFERLHLLLGGEFRWYQGSPMTRFTMLGDAADVHDPPALPIQTIGTTEPKG